MSAAARSLYVPGEHRLQLAAAACGEKEPAGQAAHVAAAAAPHAAEKVPAGQGVGPKERAGQKKPAGHPMRELGAAQNEPAGQSVGVRARMR